MAFLARPTVGLDIGTRVVKAVQLKKSGRNIELEKFGMAEIYPSGEKPADAAAQRAAVVAAIRKALEAAQITASQAVTAVAGESIIVRYIQLPEMSDDELKNALRWEAEEYIPFRVEEVNIDSAIIGRSGEGGAARIDVLLVCARKDLIAEHMELVRQAGLTPVIVDVDSFAFLNCYDLNYQPDAKEVIGLVNIGGDITSISVFTGGTPRFSRDISIGGNTVTTAIQQRLDVPFSQAEALKVKRGVTKTAAAAAPEGPDSVRNALAAMTGEPPAAPGAGEIATPEAKADRAIRNTLSNLIGEIRRSVQFFQKQARGANVTRLVLGGGGASLTGLDGLIQSELNLPVEMIDPLLRIPVTGKGIDPVLLRDNRQMLSVGIGLALRKVVD